MAANTNSSTQPDPETFDGSRRRRDNQLADTSTRREIKVRAVWPGDFPRPPFDVHVDRTGPYDRGGAA
jgi:hypothetical protein